MLQSVLGLLFLNSAVFASGIEVQPEAGPSEGYFVVSRLDGPLQVPQAEGSLEAAGPTFKAEEGLRANLPPGGSFFLTLEGDNVPEPARWRLLLIPLRTASVPPPELLGKTLASEVLAWHGLPAGRYRLLLKPRAGEVLRFPATWELAEVEITSGGEQRRSLPLPEEILEALLPPGPEGPDLQLSFQPSDTGSLDLQDLAVLRMDRRGVFPVAVDTLGETATIILPKGCQEGVTYHFETPRRVSEALKIEEGFCGNPLPLIVPLYPAGTVMGTLVAGQRLPSFGAATTLPCDEKSTAKGIRTYPVLPDEKGHFTVKLPVGCSRLSLFFPPWAGEAAGRLALKPQEQIDLGRLQLKQGGVVTGRVLDDDTLALSSDVEVSLFRVEDLEENEKAALAEVAFRLTQATDPGGWFRFMGVEPGLYHLRLLPKKKGRSVTFFGPLEVSAGDDLVLDDLLLARIGRLTLRVSPGKVADPEKYQLTLYSSFQPNCGLPAQALKASQRKIKIAKEISLDGLVPGQYRFSLQAQGPFGGAFGAATALVDLGSGETAEAELTMAGDLFRGQVLRGGEPARAKLEFFLGGDRRREDQFGIPNVYADREGKFEAMLPGPGTYRVRATIAANQFPIWLGEIEFLSQEEVVEVSLPAAQISGQVVDPEGRPVREEAGIGATREDSSDSGDDEITAVSTNREGRFRLQGLSAGKWKLSALTSGKTELRSRPLIVDLTEDESRDGVVLVLEEPEEVHGRVLADGQVPVAGARLLVRTLWLEGWVNRPQVSAIAEGDGSFILRRIPGTRAEGTLLLQAPGFPLVLRKVRLKSPLEISIPRQGGTFRVVEEEANTRDEPAGYLLVSEDGSWVDLQELMQLRSGPAPPAAGPQGGQVYGPVAPGLWRLVRLKADQWHEATRILDASGSLESFPGQLFEILPGGHQEVLVEL